MSAKVSDPIFRGDGKDMRSEDLQFHLSNVPHQKEFFVRG